MLLRTPLLSSYLVPVMMDEIIQVIVKEDVFLVSTLEGEFEVRNNCGLNPVGDDFREEQSIPVYSELKFYQTSHQWSILLL